MALFVLGSFGIFALIGEIDSVKCIGLIAAFFAPVLAIVWNLGARRHAHVPALAWPLRAWPLTPQHTSGAMVAAGSRYIYSHWRLFLVGWLAPGWWTVFIDCVGQQQGVWYFPPR